MKVTHPARWLSGQLMVTTDGTVWATWRLTGQVRYGLRSLAEKQGIAAMHTALLRSMRGEALLLGYTVTDDPASVVLAMLDGIDIGAHPRIAAECEATLDQLAEIPLGSRTLWLAVPLAKQGLRRWAAPAAAALTWMKDSADLPSTPPDLGWAQETADRIAQGFPSSFGARPATVSEQLWIVGAAASRGLVGAEPPTAEDDHVMIRPRAALPDLWIDEGARTDDHTTSSSPKDRLAAAADNGLAALLDRRVLKVTDIHAHDAHGQPPSYQALLTVTDLPAAGMKFPGGSEYLGWLDQVGFDVDWAIRYRIRTSDDAMRGTRKSVRNLEDQYAQRDDDTRGTHELDLSAELLREYQAQFAAGDDDAISQTVLLAVGSHTRADALSQARALIARYEKDDIRVDWLLGSQETLWWQMMPGVASVPLMRRLAQETSAKQAGRMVPLVSPGVGDHKGQLFAFTQSTSRPRPVLLDLQNYPGANVSGAIAVVAETGAGKTFAILSIVGWLADAGDQILAIDRSAEGEYGRFAVQGGFDTHTVVAIGAPTVSIDPLRVLEDPTLAAEALQNFLTLVAGVAVRSPEGAAIATILDAEYRARHRLQTASAVLTHLTSPDCELETTLAKTLDIRLRTMTTQRLGRAVFDESLPPADLGAAIVVWMTNALDLPTAEERTSAHLAAQMDIAKVYGQAYYALIPALARQRLRTNHARRRGTALVMDESHGIHSSPPSAHQAEMFVREGRRANGKTIFGSHDIEHDFGGAATKGMCRTRVVLRITDPALAAPAVEYLKLTPEEPDYAAVLKAVMEDLSPIDPATGQVHSDRLGEAYIRDIHGGVERVQIRGSAIAERRAAADTTHNVVSGSGWLDVLDDAPPSRLPAAATTKPRRRPAKKTTMKDGQR